jgi:hypothetical protein
MDALNSILFLFLIVWEIYFVRDDCDRNNFELAGSNQLSLIPNLTGLGLNSEFGLARRSVHTFRRRGGFKTSRAGWI